MADPTWSHRLVEILGTFQTHGYLCDLDIVASDGAVFKAHACVIAAASRLPLFESLGDSASLTTDIPSALLPCAIRYIYTGKMSAVTEEEQLNKVHNALSELGIAHSGLGRLETSKEWVRTQPLEFSLPGGTKLSPVFKMKGTQLEDVEDSQSAQVQIQEKRWARSALDMTRNSEKLVVESELSKLPSADSETENEDRDEKSQVWNCKWCKKVFDCKGKLRKHVTAAHLCAGPLVCPLCDSNVKSKNSLAAHLRYVHQSALGPNQDITPIEGEVFQCNLCMKSFRRKGHFKRHMLVHSVDRPFACPLCYKTFKDRCALESHSRYMHEGYRRMPKKGSEHLDFWCSHCGKCFKHKGSLKVHERTHRGERPFSCQYCSKSFTASSHRTRHEAIHKGQKDFQCATCGKRFSSSGILANHRYTHTDVRPHSCQICGKSFKQKSHKQRHEKLHEKAV